jgi:predicted ATP-grasp superfamily ATP-dependent carboligase
MTALGTPRVLILSLRNWLGASRLPKAFGRAGFHVTTLTFSGLLLTRSRHTNAQLFLPDRGAEAELIAACREILVDITPSVVVPTDEASVELLHAVAATASRELPASDPLLALLRDSLGDFRQHRVVRDRRALANLTANLGLRAPAHRVIHDLPGALAFAEQYGQGLVLKAEESFAGLGVSICRDVTAVEAAVSRLAGGNARALNEGVLAQAFVPGRTAMRAVVAWRGEVIAGLSALKIETHPGSTGPSSVVEFIEQPEMMSAARAMVRALGFSGFVSLDFIVEDSGAAHLIELNPRPTPICHLGEHLGRDLCVSLRQALAGDLSEDREAARLPQKVALFPQEWVRNPSSPHFIDSFHDVPWDEPDLVEACVILARQQMRWGDYRYQEERRSKIRELLTQLDRPAA